MYCVVDCFRDNERQGVVLDRYLILKTMDEAGLSFGRIGEEWDKFEEKKQGMTRKSGKYRGLIRKL